MEKRGRQTVSATVATLLVGEAMRRGIASRDRAAIVSRLESFASGILPDGGNVFSAAFSERKRNVEVASLRALGDAFWRERLTGKEERRKEGSFYTPDPIIDRILGLVWKDVFPAGLGKLEGKTVCDPALGCGFFFLRIVETLRERNVSAAKIRRWAAASLFGVDTDAQAVFVAKALLWLALSDGKKEFVPDAAHFVVGDSLLGPAFGRKGGNAGLDWNEAFPGIAERGGFDVVLGNPPYEVLTNFARHPEQKALAEAVRGCGFYRDALVGQINLYRCFIERGLDLLKSGGTLSFVTPLSLARDGAAAALRQRLLEKEKTVDWFLYGEKDRLFSGVTQSACVFKAVRNGGAAKTVSIAVGKRGGKISVGELRKYGAEFAIPGLDGHGLRLWRWFYRNCPGRLGDVAEARVGEVDQTVYRACMADTDTGTILARGAHLSAFRLDVGMVEGKERFLEREKFLAMKGAAADNCRERAEKPRIVQLGIRNMHSRPRLLAALAPPGIYAGNSLNVYSVLENVDIRFVAGVLNSGWLDWLFRAGSGNNNINLREMMNLPFPSTIRGGLAANVAHCYRECEKAAETGGDLEHARNRLDRAVGECYSVPDGVSVAELEDMLL